MVRVTLIAAIVATTAVAPSAAAQGIAGPRGKQTDYRSPDLAAVLPWGATVGLYYLEGSYVLRGIPLGTIAALAPAGFGAGHFYAGDPLRGTWVSLGGPVVTMGSAMAVQFVYSKLNPCTPGILCSRDPFFFTLLISGIAYGSWASWDAYRTAEEFNQRHWQMDGASGSN